MLRLIPFLFFALVSLNSSAQLQRKPLLGARIEYVTENASSGCKVLQVVRGTSVELKLQENDIITKIGEKTFTSADEFISQLLGDPVQRTTFAKNGRVRAENEFASSIVIDQTLAVYKKVLSN